MNDNKVKYRWYLCPMVFVMGFIPLIVRMYTFQSKLSGYSWYGSNDTKYDFFLYYKGVFLIITCVILLLIIAVAIFLKMKQISISFDLIFIPLSVYGLFVILSTLFSEYKIFAVRGMIGQFETVFVLISYCILVFYTYSFVKNEQDIKFIFRWSGFFLGIMLLLGLTQVIGHDFLTTRLGKIIMIPWELLKNGGDTVLEFEKGRVYLSLYNPNYVGSYVILILPLLITSLLFCKKMKYKIIFGLGTAGILLCVFGAQAKTAIVVIPITCIVLLLLFRKYFSKHFKLILGTVGCIIILFLAYNAFNQNILTKYIKAGLTITKDRKDYPLEHIELKEDCVQVTYNGNHLFIESQTTENRTVGFILKDDQGKEIDYKVTEDQLGIAVTDPRFHNFILTPVTLGEVVGFGVRIDERDWYFSNQTGYQGYFYFSPYGKFTNIIKAPALGFKGYENIVSGRGYIWSRSIPLIKEHIILGSGPDTFAMVFPQKDYVMKARYGFLGSLVTKPHNLYLQIAVQTGLVSLVAFLVFYGMYVFSSFKLYWKNDMDSFLAQIGAAILTGTLGYMILGLTTDSTVAVAPIFWCLMGIGLAVNRILRGQALKNKIK